MNMKKYAVVLVLSSLSLSAMAERNPTPTAQMPSDIATTSLTPKVQGALDRDIIRRKAVMPESHASKQPTRTLQVNGQTLKGIEPDEIDHK